MVVEVAVTAKEGKESFTRDLQLTLSKEKAFLNMAILKNEELMISKDPANVSYKTLRTESSITILTEDNRELLKD